MHYESMGNQRNQIFGCVRKWCIIRNIRFNLIGNNLKNESILGYWDALFRQTHTYNHIYI